nr:unnamed protein product [Callosobruchus analis]
MRDHTLVISVERHSGGRIISEITRSYTWRSLLTSVQFAASLLTKGPTLKPTC